VNPDDFDPKSRGPLFMPPYNDEVVLSDGGVYDNLGLETAYKRYRTILVSDGGQKMGTEAEPDRNWAGHSLRVLGVIDNQVRSLRKRSLIDGYGRERSGAYWGIGSHFKDYQVSDPLKVGVADTSRLAATSTRLERMEPNLQERLINWGYAICDAALRKHCVTALKEHGVIMSESTQLPYRESGL
jgi:NTE family protein